MDSYETILSLLGIGSGLTVVLAWFLWRKSQSPAFPIGMAAMYFWTLHGAWGITAALETGQTNDRLTHLFSRMFSPALDECYAWAIVLYSLFIASVGAAAYLTIAPGRRQVGTPLVAVSHARIVLTCGLAGLASVILAADVLAAALRSGVAGYMAASIASERSVRFILHKLLARAALVPASLGFAAWAAGRDGRYITGSGGASVGIGYAAVLGGMYGLCVSLGNKNELFQSLITGVVFYLANTQRPRYGLLTGLGSFLFAGIAYIDVLRGRSLADLVETLSFGEMLGSAVRIFETNEQFAAHLSMYGALFYEIPLTYGSSVASFLLSAIPRALWSSRPDDIYVYYAAGVHAVEGQGYTLHHATGWYLNFGTAGVVAGGCLFGWIWGAAFNKLHDRSGRRTLSWILLESIAFFTITGGIPLLVRAGPEGYKSLLLNCVVAPLAILLIACPSRQAAPPDHKKPVRGAGGLPHAAVACGIKIRPRSVLPGAAVR